MRLDTTAKRSRARRGKSTGQGRTQKSPARKHVLIYTDGGAKPNPGRGGYGVVLIHKKHRKELSQGFRRTTNNRMEILAAIRGLEALREPCDVTLHSDSQYLVKAMTQGWAERWERNGWMRNKNESAKNPDLWERLNALCRRHTVTFKWVRGHAGNKENERCDVLAAKARQNSDAVVDTGFDE